MGRFSIGLDLGSQQAALAVYDHSRQCSVPLEIDGDKTMPSCIALEPTGGGETVVGKRAEHRSAKKCEGVLCAYRQMIYGTCDDWDVHQRMCNERWHFNVAAGDEAGRGSSEANYVLKGDSKVHVTVLIGKVVEVVCVALLDARKAGGVLVNENGDDVEYVNFSISVPECFTEDQRLLVAEAAQKVIQDYLGALPMVVVNETLAVAMQFCVTPPFRPRKFMCLDLGSSKCTASLFELKQVSVDLFSLQEVTSRTDVFVGASEIEYRMMLWCEKRKPFAESMLASKPALFKLRREVRGAMKTLTVAEEAMIEADSVVAGNDLQLMLTLEDFEHECKDLFDAVTTLVELVVKEGGMGFVPELVLAGGAMRIPRLQKNIEKLISTHGAVIRKTVDMDRAVSLGAATVAALHCSVGVVRLPLDESQPYVERGSRVRLGKEPSGMLRELSSLPEQEPAENKEVDDLRNQNEALRNRNRLLKEAEEAMQSQLYDQQQLIERLRHDLTASPEPKPKDDKTPFRLEEELQGATDDRNVNLAGGEEAAGASAQLRGQLLLAQQEQDKAKAEASELRGRLTATETERDALAVQKQRLQDLLEQSKTGADTVETALAALKAEVQQAQRSMEDAHALAGGSEEQLRMLRQEVEGLRAVASAERESDAGKKQFEEKLAALQARMEEERSNAEASEQGRKQAEELAESLNKQVLAIQAQNTELEGQLKAMEAEERRAERADSELREAKAAFNSNITMLEAEVARLQEEKAKLEEREHQGLLPSANGGEDSDGEAGEEKSDAAKQRSGRARGNNTATAVPRTRSVQQKKAGIGLVLDAQMRVLSVNADGAARKSGRVGIGDRIVAVDGVGVEGLPLPAVTPLIAGAPGTPVSVSVLRTVPLTRQASSPS